MATKAICFLGYTKPGQAYRETTYQYGELTHTTPFMAEATASFFGHMIDQLLVLVTQEAREQNFDDLAKRFGGDLQPTAVDIPSGKDEDQLWQIFTVIGEQVAPGDKILFDITNGYRSLPVLSLLAATYLRIARGATVSRMIYGAYDSTTDLIKPVFDLTPFLNLLKWTTATEALLNYGRAEQLAKLVQELTPGIEDTSGVSALAETLRSLSVALQTSRPAEVSKIASQLPNAIAKLRDNDSQGSFAPFSLLLEQVEREYTPMQISRPHDRDVAHEVIVKQLEMIEWYVSKGLLVQAFTLTREWLISIVLAGSGLDIYDEQARWYGEAAINGFSTTKQKPPHPVPDKTLRFSKHQRLRKLWSQSRQLRNDLAHAGMSFQAQPATFVESEVRQVCGELRLCARELGFAV